MLAPGSPDDPIQVIDVRDLAEWIVGVVEQRCLGVYNATGPKDKLSVGEITQYVNDGTRCWED